MNSFRRFGHGRRCDGDGDIIGLECLNHSIVKTNVVVKLDLGRSGILTERDGGEIEAR